MASHKLHLKHGIVPARKPNALHRAVGQICGLAMWAFVSLVSPFTYAAVDGDASAKAARPTVRSQSVLITQVAPVVLARYLNDPQVKPFTQAAGQQVLGLYNYWAQEITNYQSTYTNLALWIAQTSPEVPIIFKTVENGHLCQLDNYFYHWEEQTKAYKALVAQEEQGNAGTVEQVASDSLDSSTATICRMKNLAKIEEIKTTFGTLKEQLKSMLDERIFDTVKTKNLQQRIGQVELVFTEQTAVDITLKKALFDSPALFYGGKVYVGPEMYNFPQAAVKLTLAHELAHSIDFQHVIFPLVMAKTSHTIPALKLHEHPFWYMLEQWQKNKELDLVVPADLAQKSRDAQVKVISHGKVDWMSASTFVQGNFRGNEIFADYIASLVIHEDLKRINDPMAQTRYALSAVMFNMSNAMDLRWINLINLRSTSRSAEGRAASIDDSYLTAVETVINAHLQFVLKSAGLAYPLVPARVNFYASHALIRKALQADRLIKFKQVYLTELAQQGKRHN